MKTRSRDSYEVRQAKAKKAKALKMALVNDVIKRLDGLEKYARMDDADFTLDERREIDQARFNLQSIRSGWANKGRR